MKAYLDILRNILENGEWKDNRTGTRTLTTFGEIFRHDMSEGFPLITTKKMAVRTMAVELEGFINGVTDKEWFQKRGCKIWSEWANPAACEDFYQTNYVEPYERDSKEYGCIIDDDGLIPYKHVKHHIQKSVTDLGPIYGYQWRSFGQHYDENDIYKEDYSVNKGVDQLKRAVDILKTDPNNRKLVISAWNPNQIHLMGLEPCHFAFNLMHLNGKLNLVWHQRSCDFFLGIPMNIASYALLLTLLCKECNLKPGILMGTLADAHIYENHIEQVKQQLERTPRKLPSVTITSEGLWDWTHKHFKLNNYDPHPAIKGKVAV